MENRKWEFEINGRNESEEPETIEEIIEEVVEEIVEEAVEEAVEEVIEEVIEEIVEEVSDIPLGTRDIHDGNWVYWDGKNWVDRSAYQRSLQ